MKDWRRRSEKEGVENGGEGIMGNIVLQFHF